MNKIRSRIKNLNSNKQNQKLSEMTENTPEFSLKGEVYKTKIVRVYDGDTLFCIFKFNGKYSQFRVRMLGYNSPEMKPNSSIPEEEREVIKQKAQAAKNRLEELTLNKIVLLYCHDFDNFGRILGEIKLDSKDKITVNQIMVDEGHGIIFPSTN